MKLIYICFIILFISEKCFSLHQSLNAFLKDNADCYNIMSEKDLIQFGETTNYKLGIRFQNYSRSMETFINLVEKIENTYEERSRRISAETLIKHLLKSYHIYGLHYLKFNMFDVKKYHLLYDELTDILLDNGGTSRIDISKDILTFEEQCIMHYMLSRFIWPLNEVQTNFDIKQQNQRYNPTNTIEAAWHQVKARVNSKNMQFKNSEINNQVNKFDFYEQGVVRFRDSETDGIETSRVLVGILAGLITTPKLNNQELFEKLQQIENFKIEQYLGNTSSIRNNKRLDALIALTLSDLWAQNSQNSPTQLISSPKKNSQNGAWNNAICPVFYQLQPSANNQNVNNGKTVFNGFSLAQLRGGLDGLSIGWALSNKRFPKSQIKLSQILKMYYSPRGLRPLAEEASICRRSEIFDLFLKQIKQPTLQYLQLIILYLSKGQIKDDFHLLPYINEMEMEFQSKLSDASTVSDENRQWCQDNNKYTSRSSGYISNGNAYEGLGDQLSDNSINSYNKRRYKFNLNDQDDQSKSLETANDLIFLVDMSNYVEQQLSIINKILTRKTMYNGETVTILLNRPGKNEFSSGLDVVSWRSQVKDKPVCELKNLIKAEKQNNIITKAAELLDRIENVLQIFKSQQNVTMISGKTFILFNYGFIKHDQSQEFLAAKHHLFVKQRDVHFAIIGQGDRGDLKNLMNFNDNTDNVFADTADIEQISFHINKLITENPAIIMYGKCDFLTSRFHETIQTEFITPDSAKYFTINPDYFMGTQNLELKFEVQSNRHMKVCISRKQNIPFEFKTSNNNIECKSTVTDSQTLIFNLENPCNEYSRSDCPSINIGIFGIKDDSPVIECFDSHCSNFEQIKFDFSHQGMICNSCLSISVHILNFVFIIFIFILQRYHF